MIDFFIESAKVVAVGWITVWVVLVLYAWTHPEPQKIKADPHEEPHGPDPITWRR